MRTRSKLWLTALTTAAVMATAVGAASARNLSISNTNIRVTFTPLVFFSGENRLSCNVTLEGSFHYRTIVKVLRSLLGYITRVQVHEANCRGAGSLAGATARPNTASLPWHITYEGFEGALPNIRRVFLLLFNNFILENVPLVGRCGYGGNARGSFLPPTSEIQADESVAIPKLSGSAFCPGSGFFSGRGPATLLGTSTRLTITLI